MSEPITKSEILNLRKPRTGRAALILLVVGIIVLIAIVVFLIVTILSTGQSTWQAVFLVNGQTYFGHIVKEDAKSITLHDVHYLQMQQIPPAAEEEQPQQQLSIFKLGDNEIHGPENEMRINWQHILFVEKLKKDSQVISTIEQMEGK